MEQINPWKTISSSLIYTNPWIELVEHQVINPSGNPGIYGKVHFHNKAVGVIPYQDGKIWMVGQYRYTLDQYSWEIPAGGCPEGETTEACAFRELQEETGIIAGILSPLFQMHLSNSVSDEWGIVYLAEELNFGKASPEDTEDLKVKIFSLEEVFQQIEEGKITDSLTVAGIFRLMLKKSKGELI